MSIRVWDTQAGLEPDSEVALEAWKCCGNSTQLGLGVTLASPLDPKFPVCTPRRVGLLQHPVTTEFTQYKSVQNPVSKIHKLR